MKKIAIYSVFALSALLVACGGGKSAEDDAARKQREADSLAAIERARLDSIEAANAPKSIVETALNDEQFSTLVSLLSAAGLVETLSDLNRNFTVFAPTNAAFDKLGKKKLDELADPKNADALKDVLLYHVVAGKLLSADIAEVSELDALDEKVITVTANALGVKVSGANVTTADIDCSNGVIHVVDAVLTVPAKKSVAKKPTPKVEDKKSNEDGLGRKSDAPSEEKAFERKSNTDSDKSNDPFKRK
jgi:uncharacterized surface protein with fasciclin (FAS1) repeats